MSSKKETSCFKEPALSRREIASRAATAMHQQHPAAARTNGAKGGLRTAESFPGGASAWGRGMAAARWHPTPSAEPELADQPTLGGTAETTGWRDGLPASSHGRLVKSGVAGAKRRKRVTGEETQLPLL